MPYPRTDHSDSGDRTTAPTGPARWRVSSYCGASNTCVAVAPAGPAGVAVRDQADPNGPALTLTRTAFAALLNAINRTNPDLPTGRPADGAATTQWAALDGPDCPTCQTSDTAWDGISADYFGDWWTCRHDHLFLLTPEGQAIPYAEL